MSDEIQARQKYNCPSCGAEAQWNPGKHALVCPYCGTVSPAEIKSDGTIEEHDLVTALRAIGPDRRGCATEKKSVKCQSCQAITVFDANRAAQRCDFCGSAAIIPVDQQTRPIRPDSLLEFKVAETAVREANRAAVRKAIGVCVEGRDPVAAARLVSERDTLRNPFYSGG